MKKKIVIALIVVIALISLIPMPRRLKDGGTVEYKALLYKISRVHSLTLIEEMKNGKEYNEGLIVEVLGFEIYNSVE